MRKLDTTMRTPTDALSRIVANFIERYMQADERIVGVAIARRGNGVWLDVRHVPDATAEMLQLPAVFEGLAVVASPGNVAELAIR
jgi:hypothetical protein